MKIKAKVYKHKLSGKYLVSFNGDTYQVTSRPEFSKIFTQDTPASDFYNDGGRKFNAYHSKYKEKLERLGFEVVEIVVEKQGRD